MNDNKDVMIDDLQRLVSDLLHENSGLRLALVVMDIKNQNLSCALDKAEDEIDRFRKMNRT